MKTKLNGLILVTASSAVLLTGCVNPNGTQNNTGTVALIGGALGALGAVCIIWAFKAGGIPNYVMPLVFGGAPLINVVVSMATHPPKTAPNPLLYVGFLLAALGGGLVLYYKPS